LSSSTTLPIPQQLTHPFCSNQLSYDESTAYHQLHTYRATHLYTMKQRAYLQFLQLKSAKLNTNKSNKQATN
jgi:hypothetical protein